MTGTRKAKKLIHGVGVNDVDRPVYTKLNGKRLVCPVYRTWQNMLGRCYDPKYIERHPSYSGCNVTEDWLYLSRFEDWMLKQDWEGKQLDKDILVVGNKLYSPETCAFIPREVNLFTIDSRANRGEYPLGVYLDKELGRFMAQCSNPFTRKKEHLGVFDNPEDAHEAWRKRKHELALIYADQQTDPRVAEALRTRYLN